MGKQRLLEQAQELFFSIWRNFKFLVVFHGHVAAFAFGLPWRNSGAVVLDFVFLWRNDHAFSSTLHLNLTFKITTSFNLLISFIVPFSKLPIWLLAMK